MKKLSLLLFVTIFFQGYTQVCNPVQTGTPGLTPLTANFPCVDRGSFFDEVIYIENFDTIYISSFYAVMVFLRIDSVTNIPCGLSWQSNKPSNRFGAGEAGCIRVSGTTMDDVGQYKIGLYFTIGGLVPIISPDTLTISGEASYIVDSLQTLFNVNLGLSWDYWVRVKESASVCPALDTTMFAHNLTACNTPVAVKEIENNSESLVVYPNPNSGVFNVQIDNAKKDTYNFGLYDLQGREIYFKEIGNASTSLNYSFDLNDFPKGIYTLKVVSETTSLMRKVALY